MQQSTRSSLCVRQDAVHAARCFDDVLGPTGLVSGPENGCRAVIAAQTLVTGQGHTPGLMFRLGGSRG